MEADPIAITEEIIEKSKSDNPLVWFLNACEIIEEQKKKIKLLRSRDASGLFQRDNSDELCTMSVSYLARNGYDTPVLQNLSKIILDLQKKAKKIDSVSELKYLNEVYSIFDKFHKRSKRIFEGSNLKINNLNRAKIKDNYYYATIYQDTIQSLHDLSSDILSEAANLFNKINDEKEV